MNTQEICKEIGSKMNKSAEEVMLMAEGKRQALNGNITIDGALMLIASDNGINLNSSQMDIKIEEADAEVSEVGRSSHNEEELNLDDLGKKFLPSPRVGDTVIFTLDKIKKSKNVDAVDRTGKKFKTSLTSVDYKMVYVTNNGEEFSPKSWECVGKIHAICRKLKKITGIEISVRHVKDGMKEKEGDSYEVKTRIDGTWKVLDRKTNDWK